MRSRKNSLLSSALAFAGAATALAACGGGAPTPTPPSGGFSNASLKGQYAFSLTGVEIENGAYAARIGSFTADGAGNIGAGLEDQLNLSAGQPASQISFTGGTYQIQNTGTGTISLQAASGTLQLSVVLQSASTGFVVETDLGAATSGSIHLQTASDFSLSGLTNQYVFELYGVTFVPSTAAPLSLIGEFNANGGGAVTGGVMDIDNGNQTPSGATPIPATSYAMDPSNGATFGRGTMTLNGYDLAFYIVDSTHLVLLEEDTAGGSAGDAYLQSASIPTQNSQLTGSFVYQMNGLFTKGTQGPISRVARFTTDGSGVLTAVTLDTSYNGNYTHSAQASSTSYAMDTSNAGSGRGTFGFTASGFVASNVFYLISPTQALVQETSPGVIAVGPMMAQGAGPFALSGLTGNFVLIWNGVQLGANTAIPIQESFAGQFALANTSNNNISGAIDYTEMGLTGNSLFTDVTLGGTLTINGDGTTNNLYKFAVIGSPSITVNFEAYFASPSTVFLVTQDNNRTFIGTLVQQSQ
jgi:hypothetical protein